MITLRTFFEVHGYATAQPRTVRPFHATLLDALGMVVRGTLPDGKRNLLINIGPSLGKTFMAHDFVSYGLGAYPDARYIYTSYSGDLATKETRSILQTAQSDWYKSIFPHVTIDKASADYFTTTAGGQVYGPGFDGTITGFRAGRTRQEFGGAIVIDDALKAGEARSLAAREHCHQIYTGTLKSRKDYTKTPIVMIGQRLHPDDLPGFVLKTEPEDWHVIKVPALNEDGTSIWPDKITAADLKHLEEVDPDTYFAQYQQMPQAPGGNMFKREWWRYYNPADYDVTGLVFLTADTALKDKEVNDPSCLQAWHGTQENLDLLEDFTRRMEFPDLLRAARAFWDKWRKFGATAFYIEDKASGSPLANMLAEQGVPVILWKPGDYNFPDNKLGRAKFALWPISAGRIRLPRGKDFTEPFIEQHAAFTGDDSVHDDSVDAMTMAVSVWIWKGGSTQDRPPGQ
jgi:predicted phage terminase large subunit-like protein